MNETAGEVMWDFAAARERVAIKRRLLSLGVPIPPAARFDLHALVALLQLGELGTPTDPDAPVEGDTP